MPPESVHVCKFTSTQRQQVNHLLALRAREFANVKKSAWFTLHGYFCWLLALAGCASSPATLGVADHVRELNDVGLTDFTRGKFSEARQCFELALQLTPHDANLLFNLAQCDDRLGNYQSAESYYRLSQQNNPKHVEARFALGMLYYRTGRKEELKNMLEQWHTEQPDSAEPYALDGWRLRQERNLTAARDRQLEALGKDKRNAHAMTELGILYETLNWPEEALVYYERSLARNPNQPDVIDRLTQLKLRNIGPPRPD